MICEKAECLIIGGGLTGWMAARELVNAGADVLMLQDGMGASPWVHGVNVPVVREDSAECFFQDTLISGQGLSDPALAKALCGDAEIVFQELQAMGLRFNQDGNGYQALRPLGSSWPRVISIGNDTGVQVLEKLRELLRGRLRELPGTRAVRLIKRENRAAGALAYDTHTDRWITISAKTVILACGGFCGIYPVSTNKRDSGGDGVAMAYEAGARLCDMEFIQFEPSAAVWPESLLGTSVITTMLFEGAVFRNRSGERFMLRYGFAGETVGKDVMAQRIAAEIAAGKGTEHGGVYFDATALGRDRLMEKYASYVERYEKCGIDLSQDWIELAPAPHTSLGGVSVDGNGCTDLKGLFACGEVMGGLHGANRIGGSAGLETLVFGRRAGRAAATLTRETDWTAVCGDETNDSVEACLGDAPIGDTLDALRGEMRAALMKGAYVIRTRENVQSALNTLCLCIERVKALRGSSPREEFLRARLYNDLTAAMLCCRAADAREDSVGCHTRADFEKSAEKPYRVILQRGADGWADARKEWLPE